MPAPTRNWGPCAANMLAMIEEFQQAWDELTAPGAQFATTTIDVRGVPIKVFESALPSMRTVWELARGYGDRDYVVYEDERYTFAEADAIIRALAAAPRRRARRPARRPGRPGDAELPRVGVRLLGGRSRSALRCVGMNAWWTTEEMEYGLSDSKPKVLIADGERVERVLPVLDELRAEAPLALMTVRYDGELPDGAERWEDVIDPAAAPAELPSVDIDPDDDACIFYTSGTTGFPKGAQLTHRGSVHNLLNIVFMTTVAGAGRGEGRSRAAAGADRRRAASRSSRCSWRRPRCSTSRPTTACSTRRRSPAGASCSPTSGMPAGRSN